MPDSSKPDFSRGGYYRNTYSRAQNTLFVGLLIASLSAASLPLFVSHPLGLAFNYLGCAVVSACAYKWGAKISLPIGVVLGLGDLVLLSPYVGPGLWLQLGVGSSIVSFAALSVGFSSAGRIARDFHDIKFSDRVPKAMDREKFLMLLDKELARAKRYRQVSSVAILEIGILDKAEKAFGYHQTELVLRQVQAVLVRQLRKSDTLAWLAGPYFALLFPGTGRDGAEVALDRLKDSLRGSPMRPLQSWGKDVSNWRTAVADLKGDDADSYIVLRKVASDLDPLVPERIGMPLEEQTIYAQR